MTEKPKPMHPRQFTVFELPVLITVIALLVWVVCGLWQHNAENLRRKTLNAATTINTPQPSIQIGP
jgi:Tfp pilus assembly protein PilE